MIESIGKYRFRELADRFLASRPPQSPFWRDVPGELSPWLSGWLPAAAEARDLPPHTLDLTRFEWAEWIAWYPRTSDHRAGRAEGGLRLLIARGRALNVLALRLTSSTMATHVGAGNWAQDRDAPEEHMSLKVPRFVRGMSPDPNFVSHGLFHWPDVPCAGPQLLAYRVSKAKLYELRSALRLVVEGGDAREVRRFFFAHIDEHYASVRNTRWRIPRSTLVAIGDLMEWWAEQLPGEALAEVERGAGRTLATGASLARGMCEETSLLVDPQRWAAVSDCAYDIGKWKAIRARGGVTYRVMKFTELTDTNPIIRAWIWTRAKIRSLIGEDGREEHHADAPISSSFVSLIAGLQKLSDSAESIRIREPEADVAWIRTCRFFLEEDGTEVPAEGVRNYMRDTVVRRTGSAGLSGLVVDETSDTTCPMYAFDDLVDQIALPSLEEILVGPYRMSQGPGPFMGSLRAARPLHDPAWGALPLFRVPQMDARLSWPIDYLVDDGLTESVAEVEAAAPSNVWWSDYDREPRDLDGFWQPFEVVRDAAWTDCRDRFIALLKDAQAADEAVVTYVAHADPAYVPPCTPAWGRPVNISDALE